MAREPCEGTETTNFVFLVCDSLRCRKFSQYLFKDSPQSQALTMDFHENAKLQQTTCRFVQFFHFALRHWACSFTLLSRATEERVGRVLLVRLWYEHAVKVAVRIVHIFHVIIAHRTACCIDSHLITSAHSVAHEYYRDWMSMHYECSALIYDNNNNNADTPLQNDAWSPNCTYSNSFVADSTTKSVQLLSASTGFIHESWIIP